MKEKTLVFLLIFLIVSFAIVGFIWKITQTSRDVNSLGLVSVTTAKMTTEEFLEAYGKKEIPEYKNPMTTEEFFEAYVTKRLS